MKPEACAGSVREPPKVDRRRESRIAAQGVVALMRPGQHLVVVDVSASGALVEGGRPLRPGSDIEVQLESDARGGMVGAHVMRCSVAALHGESGVTYRAALAFTEACDWVREILTLKGMSCPAGIPPKPPAGTNQGTAYPRAPAWCETRENGEPND